MLKLLTGYTIKQWLMGIYLLIEQLLDSFTSLDKESKSDILITAIGVPVIITAIIIGVFFVASMFESIF